MHNSTDSAGNDIVSRPAWRGGWIAEQLIDVSRRRRPGAVPGEFVSDPTALPVRIRVIQYDADDFEEVEIRTVDEVRKYAERSSVTWVNVDGIRDTEIISAIGKMFGIHRLVLEDIVSPHQRAKVEDYGDQLFIVARMPEVRGGFDTEQLGIVLCDHVVVTFQERTGDCLEPVRNRLRQKLGRIRERGHDYLVYALLDAVIDAYFPVLSRVSERMNEMEQQLARELTVDTVAVLQRLRTVLFMIQGTIAPHNEVITQLLRNPTQIKDGTRVYLRDCSDHVAQVMHATETSRELAADLRDYCFAEISFNQNETMKLLTVMASVFIPLSFVAGFYGMNFDPSVSQLNMPETKWKYGYLFAIILMISIAGLTLAGLWLLKRYGRKARRKRFNTTQRVLD
ncbi:MAG: magnesium/cobalt transporter CorA [Fuerstiella sp.]